MLIQGSLRPAQHSMSGIEKKRLFQALMIEEIFGDFLIVGSLAFKYHADRFGAMDVPHKKDIKRLFGKGCPIRDLDICFRMVPLALSFDDWAFWGNEPNYGVYLQKHVLGEYSVFANGVCGIGLLGDDYLRAHRYDAEINYNGKERAGELAFPDLGLLLATITDDIAMTPHRALRAMLAIASNLDHVEDVASRYSEVLLRNGSMSQFIPQIELMMGLGLRCMEDASRIFFGELGKRIPRVNERLDQWESRWRNDNNGL